MARIHLCDAICCVLLITTVGSLWYGFATCVIRSDQIAKERGDCRDNLDALIEQGACNITSIFAPTVPPTTDPTGWVDCNNGLWTYCVNLYTDRFPGRQTIIQGGDQPNCTILGSQCSTPEIQLERARALRADNSHSTRECFVYTNDPNTIHLHNHYGDEECNMDNPNDYRFGAVMLGVFGLSITAATFGIIFYIIRDAIYPPLVPVPEDDEPDEGVEMSV